MARAIITKAYDNHGSVKGNINNKGRSDDESLKLIGKGDPGETIRIYDGNKLLGTTKVNSKGAWSFTTESLSHGQHNFTVRSEESNSRMSSASPKFRVLIDTKVNEVDNFKIYEDKKLAGDLIGDGDISVRGKSERFAKVEIFVDGDRVAQGKANKKGKFNINLDSDLEAGAHNITVVVTDMAGNKSEHSIAQTVTIAGAANNPPQVAPTVDSLMHHPTGELVLTGTAKINAGDTLTVSVNGQNYTEANGLTFEGERWFLNLGEVDWAEGFYDVNATISNMAGSISDNSTDELRVSTASLGQAGVDTDGDEISDDIDIDDDNDGILDIVEGAGDRDGDGLADYLDIDSDNDGIADNIEAQSTFSFKEPTVFMDIDGDGLNDIFDADTSSKDALLSAGLDTQNTDGSGFADYKDFDSDNDGIKDIDESGLVYFDISRDYANPAGGIDPFVLADTFGSDERDYREIDLTINRPIGPVKDIDSDFNQVSEDAAIGDTVGLTAEAIDPDAGDTVRYELIQNPDDMFAINEITGVVTLAGKLDFDTQNLYQVSIKATSSDGSSSFNIFNINVLEVNNPVGPVSDVDGAANEVREGLAAGAVVGLTAFAEDPDKDDTVSYSLFDDAGGRFEIDADSGVVQTTRELDINNGSSYEVIVKAESSDTTVSTETFTINVLANQPIGPVKDIDSDKNEVMENASKGSRVGLTAEAIDPDSDDTVRYELIDDADGRFAIHSKTGVVTLKGNLDYDVDTSHTIKVRANSSDGSSSEKKFTIDVLDHNEPIGPVIDTDNSVNEVSECAKEDTEVGITALAEDPDTAGKVTYKLLDDAGGRFKIDENTGVVTTTGSGLDYETDPHHDILIQATSPDGSKSEETMRVNIIDEEISIQLYGVPGSYDAGYPRDISLYGTTNAEPGTEITVFEKNTMRYSTGITRYWTREHTAIVQDDGSFRIDSFRPYADSLNPHRLQNGQIHYPGYSSSTSYVAYLGDEPMPGNTECHATSAYSTMSVTNTRVITPLVLDLDGDGVELIAMSNGVDFDINADGLIDRTAWAASDDGLLVFDRNNDGLINDGSELFGEHMNLSNGDNAENGFAALADLDSNGDGIFDAKDHAFTQVQVWQDKNSDGISQEDELLNLEDIGLESINLEAQEVDEVHDAGVTGLRSSWTDTEGNTHDIDDVWLEVATGISDEEALALGLSDLLSDAKTDDINLTSSEASSSKSAAFEQDGTAEMLDLTPINPIDQLDHVIGFY